MVRLLHMETLCLGGESGTEVEVSTFGNARRGVLIEVRERDGERRYIDFDATPAEARELGELLISAAAIHQTHAGECV